MFYWQIGQCINQEVLGYEWADFGKQIVATLSLIKRLSHH
jgi:hypothetical protein